MKKTLIISKTEKATEKLRELLQQEGYEPCTVAFTVLQAKEKIAENEFDLIVVYTPIEDIAVLPLCNYLTNNTKAGVFLLAGAQTVAQLAEALQQQGIVILARPIERSLFRQSLHVWQSSRIRFNSLQKENEQLKTQVEEIKIIHRAKCVLMQSLAMSEAQAHRYLEKQAMDLRQSKKKVAEQVLNTYEM
ncbi:hypothetical protein AGMMS50284_3150 [Clostridia bacterium]|nr:hypothetical protein AGMMS50284_3150 [Clostridia bacterium]